MAKSGKIKKGRSLRPFVLSFGLVLIKIFGDRAHDDLVLALSCVRAVLIDALTEFRCYIYIESLVMLVVVFMPICDSGGGFVVVSFAVWHCGCPFSLFGERGYNLVRYHVRDPLEFIFGEIVERAPLSSPSIRA